MTAADRLVVASAVVRFVLNRLDDDDSTLDRIARSERRGVDKEGPELDGLQAIDRLRAENIAKRHVIGDLQQLLVLRDLPTERAVRDIAIGALAAMALPYAAHRDFRADWQQLLTPVRCRSSEPS